MFNSLLKKTSWKMVAYKPFENTDEVRQNSFVTIDLNKNNIKVDRNQMLTMKKAVVFGTVTIGVFTQAFASLDIRCVFAFGDNFDSEII